jgi:YVTN family beta-propeller protein
MGGTGTTGGKAGTGGATAGSAGTSAGAAGSTAGAAGSTAGSAGAGGSQAGAGGATGGKAGTAGQGGSAGASAGSAGNGGSGGAPPVACTTTAKGTSRGSAIALTPDDKRLVAVNRDAGTVTVMSVDYSDGQPKTTVVAELAVGAEPWQVVVDGCGTSAYVVLRKDQKVVRIDQLAGTPVVGPSVAVGSEPSGLALTPNNTKLYVSNWVDGTLSVIDPLTMTLTTTVDLNPAVVATGALGTVTPRAALAHPRGIAITNNGDASDADETLYATEWFALRTGPEDATGTNSDTNWKGIVYAVKDGGAVTTIDLPSVKDTGFVDHKNQATGCFPNQIQSITIEGTHAYVSSTCASPVGPLGVFQKNACTGNAQCAAVDPTSTCSAGACTLSCTTDTDCAATAPAGTCVLPAGTCKPVTTDVKTTTHPAVSVIDLAAGTATTTVLDALFDKKGSARMPLLPTDIAFINGFGYVSAMGSDAVFRLVVDKTSGSITDVGSAINNFIDLRKDATDKLIRLPIGVATAHTAGAFAFVDDDGSRDVTALTLNQQAIAGNAAAMDFRITQSSALPTTPEDTAVLAGKRFFNTGLGRWSLKGQGWGSCGACHIDGLSDNVTWYFNRGPRQTVSLDGTFASGDPTDQRILNWTGIFDEIADFENNVRGVSGGVGAIVSATSAPPANTDRIDLNAEAPPQTGLQGATGEIADPAGTSAHPHSKIDDWKNIEAYVKSIRSPRRPTNLVAADVAAGKALFSDQGQGNCVGCHSGAKWTISKRFYTPGDLPNAATADAATTSLSNVSWNTSLNGFPAALFPATAAASQNMRFGAPPGAEQIQCVLRPVGTIGAITGGVPAGVSDPAINVLELRQDMVTGGQGAADTGRGFNPPSLLGQSVAAPFFHAGNARTLEEVFASQFKGHSQSAVAQIFAPSPDQVRQLVAYVLSVDESEAPFAVPALGNAGGDLCHYP